VSCTLIGYAIFFNEYEKAMYIGLTSLVLRQAGHYIFEPPCHDKEQAMLGFDTENKVKIVITYGVIPALIMVQIMLTTDVQISLAQAWLIVTFSVVFGRVALLWYRYGFMVSMHWFVKFITDPFSTFTCFLLLLRLFLPSPQPPKNIV
jgi:glutamate-1-semialdehyde 2,1-aminomutase